MLRKIASLAQSFRELGVMKTLEKIRTYRSDASPTLMKVDAGNFSYLLVENDALSSAVVSGNWENHLSILFDYLVKDGDNVIDLGANFGIHTLSLSRRVGKGKVFAFEPLSLTCSQLQYHVILNKLENVTVLKLAVSNVSGKYIEMEKIFYGRSGLNVGNASIGSGGDATLSVKIDDIKFPKIDFIKIDIQGSEMAALLGMANMLTSDRPIMIVELEEHHLKKMGASSKSVIEYLLSFNYILHRINTDYPCDHLAVPKERNDEVEATIKKIDGLTFSKIEGSFVDLSFENSSSPNYKSIKIT